MRRMTVAIFSCALMGLSVAATAPGGDFNGDGTDDIAVFRPSSGLWAIRGVSRIYWGTWNDEPVPGDYNGDGVDEVGIYRASAGVWSCKRVGAMRPSQASDRKTAVKKSSPAMAPRGTLSEKCAGRLSRSDEIMIRINANRLKPNSAT